MKLFNNPIDTKGNTTTNTDLIKQKDLHSDMQQHIKHQNDKPSLSIKSDEENYRKEPIKNKTIDTERFMTVDDVMKNQPVFEYGDDCFKTQDCDNQNNRFKKEYNQATSNIIIEGKPIQNIDITASLSMKERFKGFTKNVTVVEKKAERFKLNTYKSQSQIPLESEEENIEKISSNKINNVSKLKIK